MIGRKIRWGLYALATVITIVFSILVAEIATIPIPAPLPFGIALVVFFIILDFVFENWKWKTDQLVCNFAEEDISGHYSIRNRDIFHLPWDVEIDVDGTMIKNSVQMAVCLTGGTDYWFFSGPGEPHFPVMIFPSVYLQKMGSNFVCNANLKPRTLDQIDDDLATHLVKLFPKRIRPPKTFWKWTYGGTPIYFGLTSPIDCSETNTNINYEVKISQKNETIKTLKDELDNLREQLSKREEIKEKPYVLAERVKKVGNED